MPMWETVGVDDQENLTAASGSAASQFSFRWRAVAAAVAIFAATALVAVGLSTSMISPSSSPATGNLVNLQALEAAICDPTSNCEQCADETACFQCHKARDCANCDNGGNCAECYAAASLTCCEKSLGGIRNREECCQRPELQGKTPLCTRECAGTYGDCGAWQCCQTPGWKCYTKHAWYAQCRPSCARTKVEPGVVWDCDVLPAAGEGVAEPLQCAAEGENCRESRCCQNQDMSCYEKNRWWSSCRTTETCIPGLWEAEKGFDWYSNWTCKLDEDPKAGCQTEKVKTFHRRRAYHKPVEACEKLGAGWFPVEDKQKCADLARTETTVPMVELQDKRYHVSGCSFNYATQEYEWNSEPGSYKKCSNDQACMCQKCEPLAPI